MLLPSLGGSLNSTKSDGGCAIPLKSIPLFDIFQKVGILGSESNQSHHRMNTIFQRRLFEIITPYILGALFAFLSVKVASPHSVSLLSGLSLPAAGVLIAAVVILWKRVRFSQIPGIAYFRSLKFFPLYQRFAVEAVVFGLLASISGLFLASPSGVNSIKAFAWSFFFVAALFAGLRFCVFSARLLMLPPLAPPALAKQGH